MPIKRIVSFGCSLIYGDELTGWDPGDNKGSYARDKPNPGVWPEQLAKAYGVPHINKGFSGASNEFIHRHLMRYLFYKNLPNYEWSHNSIPNLDAGYEDGDFIIVQWTSFTRNEIYNRDRVYVPGKNFDRYVQLQAGFIENEVPDDRNVYRNILAWDDDNSSAERMLNKIISTQAMTLTITDQFMQCFGLSEPVYEGAMLDKRMELEGDKHVFEEFGHFLKFAYLLQLPFGKGNHPLEAAHAEYAELVLKHLEEQFKLLRPQQNS